MSTKERGTCKGAVRAEEGWNWAGDHGFGTEKSSNKPQERQCKSTHFTAQNEVEWSGTSSMLRTITVKSSRC